MLYLNDGFSGGATNFFKDTLPIKHSSASGEIVQGDKTYLTERIAVTAGSALVFTQQTLLHEGEQVTSGQKYALRSDIMFTRTTKRELTPQEIEGGEALQRAKDAEAKGDLDDAVLNYRRAFKLDPSLEATV
ncbi:uncharacterized protein LOC106156453 [Durusdinium trenchii]|uniref:Uncharacterized protein LOC106156453 n=1 Tax=Durusdinium trenchii TaxID=1381693 RepID=A0ABP0HWK8_9DINO